MNADAAPELLTMLSVTVLSSLPAGIDNANESVPVENKNVLLCVLDCLSIWVNAIGVGFFDDLASSAPLVR